MNAEESSVEAARLGRGLIRRCERAALATSMLGAPYASLVLLASDLDATPLLFISDLAQHSRNLAFDPRASLLLESVDDHADRLQAPRLTLIGRVEVDTNSRLLARFTARHPTSAVYAGFADFRLYRFTVERGHLVAGFGRIEWIDGDDLLLAGDNFSLAAAEPSLLARANQNPAALNGCVQQLLGRTEHGWQLTGLDHEGIDLRCGVKTARLDFPAPALTPEAARKALGALAKKAHAAL